VNSYLFVVLAILQAADVYTTLRIIEAGGYERNRFMRWLMAEFGVTAALVLSKVLMLILVLTMIESLPVLLLGVMCAFYVVIVANNLIVIKKQERG